MASLAHLGLTVGDRERSVSFYRDVVGFEVVRQNDFTSVAFGQLTANPGARIKVAMMRLGELTLQLCEYVEGGGETLHLGHPHMGSPHLCISVDDVDACYARVGATDVPVTSPGIVEIMPGTRSFYVADPDGVPVEFIQYAKVNPLATLESSASA